MYFPPDSRKMLVRWVKTLAKCGAVVINDPQGEFSDAQPDSNRFVPGCVSCLSFLLLARTTPAMPPLLLPSPLSPSSNPLLFPVLLPSLLTSLPFALLPTVAFRRGCARPRWTLFPALSRSSRQPRARITQRRAVGGRGTVPTPTSSRGSMRATWRRRRGSAPRRRRGHVAVFMPSIRARSLRRSATRKSRRFAWVSVCLRVFVRVCCFCAPRKSRRFAWVELLCLCSSARGCSFRASFHPLITPSPPALLDAARSWGADCEAR